ncbi:MAG: putative rane protein [Pseudonocardiales bacterium]|nr:putative rane protein [Pseudonocardiales bacterium]
MVNFGSVDPSSPVGYVVAFTVPMLDAFLPVVPSESVVIGLGVLASDSFDLRLIPLVLLLVAAGAFCGDNISYWLGRRFGTRVADRLMSGSRGRRSREWADRTLKRYGMRLLIAARFIPGGRTAVTITAGLTHYDRRRFVVAVAVAAVLWTGYAFGIGLVGGRTFKDNTFAAFGLAFAVAAVVSVLVEVGRRLLRRFGPGRETVPPC